MAASKPPKHDFAPSWLKIPNQETNKPDRSNCRASEHRGRREDHCRYDYHNYPLPRQRSFDSYEDHPRPYVHPSHRHNSFEDDYHAARVYYNGYDDLDRSHPLLHRSGSRDSRDGKYPHYPHRYPHSQMNGHGYQSGYYDYAAYPGHHHHHQGASVGPAGPGAAFRERDYYNGYGGPHPGRHRTERQHSGGNDYDRKEIKKENSSNSRTEEEKVVKLDEEFPSLNGDSDGAEQKNAAGSKVTTGINAWETPPKVQAKPCRSEQSGSPDTQRKDGDKTSSSIYKALVPKASVNARKSGRDAGKLTAPTTPSNKALTNGKLTTMTNATTSKNREVAPRVSPTPPVASELLTKRLITQPRNIGDKKSEFLRTLKKTSPSRSDMDINSNDHVDGDPGDANNSSTVSNAVDIETVDERMERLNVENTDSLSSSLEAEQRLLREMGWKETDEEEEEYVITEDDKKAVENQMRQCTQRNGVTKTGTLQLKTWSPRHLTFPALATDDLSVLSSSSYSDSDSD